MRGPLGLSAMQSQRSLDDIRRMTPAQRWQMWFELASFGMDLWEANLDRAEIDRRWEVWRREHELSNANLRRGLQEADRR
ncbi:MAG: hypothetical protein WAT39_22765 [Planctomycetota bacterium]